MAWRAPLEVLDDGRGPGFCVRPSRGVLLWFGEGRYGSVRCGRSNSCSYCAWIAALENMLVVALDAGAVQPTVGLTLTTGPAIELERLRKAFELLFRWLRREMGSELAYLSVIEWTTGRGTHSGGRRRPHFHVLLKGVPPSSDLPAVEEGVSREWQRLTGAHRVELRELRTPAGATAYMVAHHHKRAQAPPAGLRGVKRFRPSKEYFARPVADLRLQARAQKREVVARFKLLADLAAQGLDPGCFDGEEWSDLVDDAIAAEPPRVVKVLGSGDLVDVKTGELLERGRRVRFA